MLAPINQRFAITVIKEIQTDGHNPLLVIADDYEYYYVKSCKRIPDFTIISEFLCNFFLQCWHIPTPEMAAVMVDPDILIPGLSINNRSHHFSTICFGSKQVKDAIDLQEFITAERKVDLKKIQNPEIIFRLTLFDIWVENDDRKPTNNNLLLANINNQKQIVAIDNSYTFSTLSYDQLNPSFVSSSFNDSILLSSIGKGILKKTKINDKWLHKVKENYYLCIENCKSNYTDIVRFIPAELGFLTHFQENIANFLFDEKRNENVFMEFVSRLKI